MAFTLNLASRRYVNRRLLSRCYGLAVLLLVLGLLALLGNSWQRFSEASRFRRQLSELQKTAEREGADGEKPPSAAELARLKKDLAFAGNIMQQDRFRWTLLLTRLEELALEGVRINTIQPDYQDKSLRLTALARDDRKMRDFLDRLLSSDDFSNVFLLEQGRLEVKDALNRPRSALGFTVVLKGAF